MTFEEVHDLELAPGLRAVCAASSPVVQNPVALDWSADGRLWVAEGVPATGTVPEAGQVVRLEDGDEDGVFDRRTVFLEGLPPVSSVMDWPPGVLIAAAPDLLYAEDTNGDGPADLVDRLFIGFGADSPARRLNSLCFGLDGWVYAASGHGGGQAQPLTGSQSPPPDEIELVSLDEADFRFLPNQGRLEPVAGLSWGGRTRDEYGHWVGLDGNLNLVQFPFARHYALRNPSNPYPDPVVAIYDPQDRPANLGSVAGTASAAPEAATLPPGGSDFHRMQALGPLRRGDLLVAAPWAHAILRVPLQIRGISLAAVASPEILVGAASPAGEAPFTPTQVRTGPDDAIWITDARTSLGTSSVTGGRVLRLEAAESHSPRLADRLALLHSDPIGALGSPNGTLRDLAHRQISAKELSVDAVPLRARVAESLEGVETPFESKRPVPVELQALSVMQQCGQLTTAELETALAARDPALRIHALRLSEPALRQGMWFKAIPRMIDDPDPGVRFQVALTLGESAHPEAAALWARMAQTWIQDSWMRGALLSGARAQPLLFLEEWLKSSRDGTASDAFANLTRALIQAARVEHSARSVAAVLSGSDSALAPIGVAELIQAEFGAGSQAPLEGEWLALLELSIDPTREAIQAERCNASDLPLLLPVLGVQPRYWTRDRRILLDYAQLGSTARIRQAALIALLRSPDPTIAQMLMEEWPRWRPSLRPTLTNAFLNQEPWTGLLLQALEEGVLAPSELSPAQQDRLLHHADGQIRSMAGKTLNAQLPQPRTKLLQRFEGALTSVGDADQGRTTFDNRCSVCHAPNPPHLPVGPNLGTIGSRTPAELAQAILDPHVLVEPDYRAFIIDTQEDDAVTGVLRNETDDYLELLMVGGIVRSIPMKNILSIRASNLSLMPEGLEAGLSPQDFADLLTYLKTLR